MGLEKNIYGLSEGVFKACQFLGLKFPPEAVNKPQLVPSDYFGDDFELDGVAKQKLCAERKWSEEKFAKVYKAFSVKFSSQKSLKQTRTDLNVYFCDHFLFDPKQNGASSDDYFAFEFYKKSLANRDEFVTEKRRNQILVACNNREYIKLTNNKSKTNRLFADFLNHDWIYTRDCTFEDFKVFFKKCPRFFSKPINGSLGRGAEIISVESTDNLEEIFNKLRDMNRILEEVVIQHESIAAFCPSTVNTIRVYSFLDVHNVVHILATSGRFGRIGGVIDNFHGGGICAIVNPKTGVITSDAINSVNERFIKHPDTGKVFKGFQYPAWEKVRALVTKMARMVPTLHHLGWDIAINEKGTPLLIEVNKRPDVGLMQAADSVGRLHLYKPLLEELRDYEKRQMQFLGYRVNNLRNFNSAYELDPSIWSSRRKFAIDKLVSDCKSLMDLGCRKEKSVESITPPRLAKYYPVDFKKHDDEVIVCDFNKGEFPDIKADACLCTLTAEFVENLPQFLANMCNVTQKQILMWCRPFDKEFNAKDRWEHSFLTDFTEEFLIKTMEQNNFELSAQYPDDKNRSIILYDFRKVSEK